MNINIIDLFAGCGGLADGFLQTNNFKTLAAVDWELTTVKTLKNRLFKKYNYSESDIKEKVLYYDIQNTEKLINGYSDSKYGNSDGLKKIVGNNKVDLIVGGPPCQAYSLAGRVRDKKGMKEDYRNYLFEGYVEIVKHFKPKFFVFENVQGILSAKPGDVLITDRIKKAFLDVGYIIPNDLRETALFDTSYYGVPQVRKRVIIFGVRADLGSKYLDDFYINVGKLKEETQTITKNFLIDLPKFFPLKDKSIKKISHETKINNKFLNHEPRFHNQRDIKIFKILAKDIEDKEYKYTSTDSLRELYKKETGKDSKFHKYNVIDFNKPSNTIPAHLHKDGLRHIHPDPEQARSITVREAARLQSFDDDFEFIGSRGDQYMMIGNAVPPKFAKILAEAIIPFFK